MLLDEPVQAGNPIIRKRSKKVRRVDAPEVQTLIQDLIENMRHANLVGMAAPQIGVNLQVFVTEIRTTTHRVTGDLDGVRVFINPRIVWSSKKQESDYEGCGSVAAAGIFAKVKRPQTVRVEALDEHGERFALEVSGLLARIIQHEYDHLQGTLFIDHLPNNSGLISRSEYIREVRG